MLIKTPHAGYPFHRLLHAFLPNKLGELGNLTAEAQLPLRLAIKIATKKVLKRTVDSPANPNFKYKKHTHTYRLKWVLRSHWQRIYHFLLLYYIYFAGSAKSRAEKNATNSKQPILVSFPTLLKNKKILTYAGELLNMMTEEETIEKYKFSVKCISFYGN